MTTSRERFLAAARGEPVDRPPVWLMRQAGRYLPEYRALRENYTFFEMASRPDLSVEITLQPIRRFGFDAAILFSDILIPLIGMGHVVRFENTGGPRISRPVSTRTDVEKLEVPDPWERSPYVPESIGRLRKEIPDTALVGFAGAPWTLASYLVEGGSPNHFARMKRFAHNEPDAFAALMDKLAETAATHLECQLEAGCDAVQLFDTWAEILSPHEYAEWVLPGVQRILHRVRQKGKPVIYFARGSAHLLPHIGETGADVLSVDWRVNLKDVAHRWPDKPLQGNLDPTLLLAPPHKVREGVRRVLDDGKHAKNHIFNLGHGILPTTPVKSVEALLDEVKKG